MYNFFSKHYNKLLFAICILFCVIAIFTFSTPQTLGQYWGKYDTLNIIFSTLRIFAYTSIIVFPLALYSKNKIWKQYSIFVVLPAIIIYDISIFALVQVQTYRYETYQLVLHIMFGSIGAIYPIMLLFYHNYSQQTKALPAIFVYLGISALCIPFCLLENTNLVNNSFFIFSNFGVWWFVQFIITIFAILTAIALPKIKKDNATTIMLVFSLSCIYHWCLNNSYQFIKFGFNSMFTNLPISLNSIIIFLLPIALIMQNDFLKKLIIPIGIIMPLLSITIISETAISIFSYQYIYRLLLSLIIMTICICTTKYVGYYSIKDIARTNICLLIYLVVCMLANAILIGQGQFAVNYSYLVSCPFYIGKLDSFAYIRLFGANIPILYFVCISLFYMIVTSITMLSINGIKKIKINSKAKKIASTI